LDRLLNHIKPYYLNGNSDNGGRLVTDLLLIFQIHLLQQCFNLSDPDMEDAIYDRVSFQKFLNIDIGIDNIPDEATILNFRYLLEKNKLSAILFNDINSYLEEKNLLLKEGTVIDAILIAAPTSTKNKKKRFIDEFSQKKRKLLFWHESSYWSSVQRKADHSIDTSTATDHDSTKTEELLHGGETDIFADKAYDNKEIKKLCRNNNIFYRITNKAKRNNSLLSE